MAWIVPVRWFKRAGSAPYFAVYIVCIAFFAIAISISEAPITERIYLDHAATTPIRPEALAAMQEGFKICANPSSPHAEGRKAKQALEDARERVKKALGWDGEVIFTSGASEALAIGLQQAKVDRRIVSAVEHDAVFRAAPDAEVVPVHPFETMMGTPEGSQMRGRVDLDRLPQCDGAIVAIQDVNSETGICQDVSQCSAFVRERGGLLLSDCSQSAGKYDLPDADMIVISAHKFGGPIGIGALLVRDYNMLEPTGGHERGYRQGTENMPAALGMAAALEAKTWVGIPEEGPEWSFVDENLDQEDLVGWCTKAPHIYALCNPAMAAQAQLIRLDAMGFAVSAGSACSSGTLKKSRVLDAFGVSDEDAAHTIRVSLGWNTTLDEVERFAAAWWTLT
jgi:cysteine desulfurase